MWLELPKDIEHPLWEGPLEPEAEEGLNQVLRNAAAQGIQVSKQEALRSMPVVKIGPPACDLSRACRHRSRAAPFLARFHRLTVDDGGTGRRLSPLLHPNLFAQRCVDALPRPIVAPFSEVAPHRRPGRKLMR